MSRIGGRMMAVSVDTPEQSRRVVESRKLPFPILADTQRQVVQAYGLIHKGAGPKGSDVAIPAHVLIDRDGRIAWRHAAKRIQDRPAPSDDLNAIKRLTSGRQ